MIAIVKRSLGPLVISVAAILGAGSAAASPIGIWYDETGRGAVEITDCNGKLCGHLIWLKETKHKEGCGLQIFGDAKPVAGGKWDNGWIIDPEKSLETKYDVEITPQGSNKLKVMGYAGMKFLSQTMIWTRAPDNLQKCNATQARAPDPAPAQTPAPPAPPKRDDGEPPSVYPPPPAASPAPPPPAPAATPEPRKSSEPPQPKSAAKAGKDCKLEFGGISVTFPCPD